MPRHSLEPAARAGGPSGPRVRRATGGSREAYSARTAALALQLAPSTVAANADLVVVLVVGVLAG